MNTSGPAWPLILVHSGDDELSYVDDADTWMADPSLSAHPHEMEDFAIDSRGCSYHLGFDDGSGRVAFERSGEIARDQFSQLVRNHLCAMKQCCVSKHHDYTLELGFDLVKKSIDAWLRS